jgi:glycine/D-amino acid oxidase-like deaminating enzyme
MSAPDVAVIGGGVLGCAVAAYLAEAGASVRLHERATLGAGASGRNSGVLEHPLDEVLEPLYRESVAAYAELDGFDAPAEAVGCLLLSPDEAEPAAQAAALAPRFPSLATRVLDPAALRAAEPALAPGLAALRLDTGRPVLPAGAVRAFAARARAAGAELIEGSPARVAVEDARVTGVQTPAGHEAAGAVVVAAGPWSPAALPDGLTLPVAPLWGVVAEVVLARPPRHVLEELGKESLVSPALPERLFSFVPAGAAASLGSSFDAAEPDPPAVAAGMREHGARFVPALERARLGPLRACARPASADGRPLLGPLPGVDGLHVATGHGAWGVTLGPASAALVARAVLGYVAIPAALAVGRA